MRFAILADIHSNLEALLAVLHDAQAQGIDRYICLGDVVGYNANPKECLDIVRDMNMICIKGNHDEYCSNEGELEGFNPHAALAIEWTREHLSEEDRAWLRDLKYVRMIMGFTIVHATLDAPQRWGYVFDKLAAATNFTYQTTRLCFFGHTHVPVAFVRDTEVRGGPYTRIKLEPGKKYFINVGSVGQPRDGDPRAGYVIYDSDDNIVELRRVFYDIEKAQKKVIEAGLPHRLADRLSVGR